MEYQRRQLEPGQQDTPATEETADIEQPRPQKEIAGAESIFITVSRMEMDPSAVLDNNELSRLQAEFVGNKVSVQDILDLVDKINGLYQASGYIGQAFLVGQDFAEGIVRIRLVEARVGEIFVQGNNDTRSSFITDRISLSQGDLINMHQLEDSLSRFNIIYDTLLRAELKPGKTFGASDLIVKAGEPEPFQFLIFSDNTGREEVGLYRAGVMFTDRSLLGFRDPLTISVTRAETTTAESISYSVPITRNNTSLGFSFDNNAIVIGSGSFAGLNISGDSTALTVSLQRPFITKPQLQLTGSLHYQLKESITDSSGTSISDIRVRNVVGGGELTFFDRLGYWQTSHALLYGKAEIDVDGSYFKYNGEVIRLTKISRSTLLLARAAWQLTETNSLVSLEQFQLGGMATARGYKEGLLIGDRGYLVSAEYIFPLLPESIGSSFKYPLSDIFQGAVFIDHGGAIPYKGQDQSPDEEDFLTSLGCGLLINISNFLSARLYYGIPLVMRNDGEDRPKIHFYLQSSISF